MGEDAGMAASCRGPVLRPGDRVAVVSPSSWPDKALLADTVAELERWGLNVQVGSHARDVWGPMAGRDEDRLADFNDAVRDPAIRAIVATRGGMGSYRIADGIDFDALARDPKPFVGFSDTTNLHMAIAQRCGVATIHGCAIGRRCSTGVRHLLMETTPLLLHRDPSAVSAPLVVRGTAVGPLLGGNLRELAGRVGGGLPDLRGAIVLIEDLRHVGIGQVDRNLTQLRRAGAFDGVAGIAVGLFDDFCGYSDRGWSVTDVLWDRLSDLGVPVLGGLTVGHGGVDPDGSPDQDAVMLGCVAELNAQDGTLRVGCG